VFCLILLRCRVVGQKISGTQLDILEKQDATIPKKRITHALYHSMVVPLVDCKEPTLYEANQLFDFVFVLRIRTVERTEVAQ